MGGGRTVAGVLVAAACIAAAAGTLHARTRRYTPAAPAERYLFLQSEPAASRLFLSWRALAADVYWIRAIQHFGRERKSTRTERRFELLDPLLRLTVALDPQFNIAYRFGAVFLALEPPNGPGRPDQAIALLEKGLAANPTRWQYAHDIGFVHYWFTGQYVDASAWFERAAGIPGAPEWLKPFAAMTRAQGGDRAGARRLLGTLLEAQEAYVREAARRALAQLQALDAMDQLASLVETYRAGTGVYPAGWPDLVEAGLLRGVPLDPLGRPFAYESHTHAVTLAPDSPLHPLPTGLAR